MLRTGRQASTKMHTCVGSGAMEQGLENIGPCLSEGTEAQYSSAQTELGPRGLRELETALDMFLSDAHTQPPSGGGRLGPVSKGSGSLWPSVPWKLPPPGLSKDSLEKLSNVRSQEAVG